MSYFDDMAVLFRDLCTDFQTPDGFVAMSFNGNAFNVVKTPDADRFEQTLQGYKLHKECQVDVLRDNYTFSDGSSWSGIKPSGLYENLTSKDANTPRPFATIGDVEYLVFAMPNDDASDPTVKLTLRRKQ